MSSALELIGSTPMVRLGRVASDVDANVYAKCEFFSPFSEEYFFAYLNWTSSLDSQGYFQLKTQLDPLVTQNMASNTLTPTGDAYSQLAHGVPSPVPEFPNALLALTIPMFALFVLFGFTRIRKASRRSR